MTTGQTKSVGSYLLVQVDFGPNEKEYRRYELLELVEVPKGGHDPIDVLKSGSFGAPMDLRRVLTFEKVKGDLTNIFYSMESSNTDFYPHQFRPVLKFIESPVGRLLIADEVGLGKTIEAVYIWKELQARQQARRLLIVCPAMLREKWRSDLRNLFNIFAEIVTAPQLLDKSLDVIDRGLNGSFVLIASLETLRPSAKFEDEDRTGARSRLARLLDRNTAAEDSALFDLVVIDEAHYLRNPSSASNRLGRLLREAAHHLVLLTATPIQIHSDNLYQLLRLISPEDFYDTRLFDDIIRANAPVTLALRSLWRLPPDIKQARGAIASALATPYFAEDSVLRRTEEQLASAASDDHRRVELCRLLESRSLLGQYMTRSRKREVLERRGQRVPQVLKVRFSTREKAIYDLITGRIREMSVGKRGVSLFALIMRQRQMASSLVAAFESWEEKGLIEELAWEDLGRSLKLDEEDLGDTEANDVPLSNFLQPGDPGDHSRAPDMAEILGTLESEDGKYAALKGFLDFRIRKEPGEKFVIFAFFRGTLKYLRKRLERDGIKTALIMGAMGETKDEVLRDFARADGPSVLLSSEVGSEGIDLQFCRIVVNYDLPWNPMRVEQRIGRLDRLGQKAEKISIISFVNVDTIEDRILMRLYDRIDLFKESIGDLEEILGEMTEKLMTDLLDPNLSEAERDRRAQEAELAIINRRALQQRLETDAVNLVGFSSYILDNIKDSCSKGRWLGGEELVSLVEDFFSRNFLGTKLEYAAKQPNALKLRLSAEAKTSLGLFVANTRPATHTRLHQAGMPVLCLFDPRGNQERTREFEVVDPAHPLIGWIRSHYTKAGNQLHPVSAIRLAASSADVPSGDYVYVVHRWSFKGLRSDHVLAFRAMRIQAPDPLSESDSETLITSAAKHGETFANAVNNVSGLETILSRAVSCEEALASTFDQRMQDFEAENTLRCGQQETGARKFAERRLAELAERLQRFRSRRDLRLVPMTEGLMRREENLLNAKLARIEKHRDVDPTMVPLAAGVIRVG